MFLDNTLAKPHPEGEFTLIDGNVARCSSNPAKPFLRWVGGKTRLLNTILPHVPHTIKDFHEPFLGSGAMFFALQNRARTCYLSDLNSELINTWKVVKEQPKAFYQRIQDYSDKQGEDAYYAVRSQSPTSTLDRAARFFFLNQTAWNGLWRENKQGVFNVPFGARAFRGIEKEFLETVSSALSSVSIEETDFRLALDRAQEGDFVYIDPPYLPISDTSKFSGYNGTRFRISDLIELSEMCQKLTHRRVNWIVSNRDNDVMRELFSHARVISFTTRRSVAAQSKRNVQPKDSPEVIIVGGPSL
jgi:DNA adenine methylase